MNYTGYEQDSLLKNYKLEKIKERKENGHCLQQSSSHTKNSKLFQTMLLRFGNLMFHKCLYSDLYTPQIESILVFNYLSVFY
jgi:hypothetical protein